MEQESSERGGGASRSSVASPSQLQAPSRVPAQPMEVGASSEDTGEEPRSKKRELTRPSFILQSLSVHLQLDELWATLSECLDWLAQTNDPHAVLIMQPTVEAFFLAHSSSAEEGKAPKKPRSSSSRSRLGHPSSFHTLSDSESNPVSPALHMDISPLPSTPSLGKGDDAYLPADTIRFFQFAGVCVKYMYVCVLICCAVSVCVRTCLYSAREQV